MSRSSVEEDADEKVNETTERDPDTTSNGSKDSTLQILRTDSSHSTSSSNSSGAVPSPSPNPDQRQGPNFPVYTSLVNEKCAESDNTQSSSALGPEHLLNVTHPAQTLRDRKRHGICSRCCNW